MAKRKNQNNGLEDNINNHSDNAGSCTDEKLEELTADIAAVNINKKQKNSYFDYEGNSDYSRAKTSDDPFKDQIKTFFQGQLISLKNIKPKDITQHIDYLIEEIQELNKEGFFSSYEETIKARIHDILKPFLFDSLVSEICDMDYDYITYAEDARSQAFTIVKKKLIENYEGFESNEPTVQYLEGTLDKAYENYNNVEYLYSLAESIMDGTNITDIISSINLFDEALDYVQDVLPNAFKENIDSIKTLREIIKEEFLQDTSPLIQSLEKKYPGLFLRIIEIFSYVHHDLNRPLALRESPKILQFIKDNGLQNVINYLEQKKYIYAKDKLYFHIISVVENELICHLGGILLDRDKELDEQKIELVNRYNAQIIEKYLSKVEENKDFLKPLDEGSKELNRPLHPLRLCKFVPNKSPYDHAVFSYPDNVEYLMDFCGGKGLEWLIHESAEYVFEVDSEVLVNIAQNIINNNSLRQEPAILAKCLFSQMMYHKFPKKIDDNPFIAETYVNSLNELKNNEDLKNNLIKDILKDLQNYIRTPEELGNWTEKFHASFNEAYNNGEYLKAQKILYHFSKYVFYSNASLDHDPLSDNPNSKAFDALKKKFKHILSTYEKETKDYNIIYPTSSSVVLKYSAKAHNKEACLDLSYVFKELKTIESTIKQQFDKAFTSSPAKYPDKIASTNLIVPMLYFLVSDTPDGISNPDQKRLFIKVPLLLSKYKNKLLSRDVEDQVNSKDDNFEQKSYSDVRHSSCELRHHGKNIVNSSNNDYLTEIGTIKNDKLNHSEPIMFLALRDPENINEIVQTLYANLKKILGTKWQEGVYKVYNSLLVTYSTNSTCDECSFQYIGNQNKFDNSFLSQLTFALNSKGESFQNLPHHFMTRGMNKDSDKFTLNTIVASGPAYSSQAKDFASLPSHYVTIAKTLNKNKKNSADSNSQENDLHDNINQEFGKLSFPCGIDIHKLTDSDDGNKTFIEYLDVSEETDSVLFESSVFMSGSKKEKFINTEDSILVDEINSNINQLYGVTEDMNCT
jgi:hypothetical protein